MNFARLAVFLLVFTLVGWLCKHSDRQAIGLGERPVGAVIETTPFVGGTIVRTTGGVFAVTGDPCVRTIAFRAVLLSDGERSFLCVAEAGVCWQVVR